MSKKNSKTRKKAVETAQKAGFDTVEYVAQSKDGSNVYIASRSTLHYCGLPLFVKSREGKAHCVNFKGTEFDECFELLGNVSEG